MITKTRTQSYLQEEVVWRRRDDAEYPYEAELDGDHLTLRLNDFPDESLYTLLVNDEEIIEFDDWPERWIRPDMETGV